MLRYGILALIATITPAAIGQTPDELIKSGLAKRRNGDTSGAIADYTKAIDLRPDFAEAYYDRAFARRIAGDLRGAIADYSSAINLRPMYAAAYINRGRIFVDLGQTDEAVADETAGINLQPDLTPAYLNGAMPRATNIILKRRLRISAKQSSSRPNLPRRSTVAALRGSFFQTSMERLPTIPPLLS